MRRAAALLLILVTAGSALADPFGKFLGEVEEAERRSLEEFLGKVVEIERLDVHPNRRLLQAWTPGQPFQDFLSSMMGVNWTEWVPQSWAHPGFTWDNLGSFEYSSNLKDFLDDIDMYNLTKPHSLHDLQQRMEVISSYFCTPETFTPSEKVDANCVGPSVTLAYMPKVCVLNEDTHEILCDPAKIVLSKSPGSCTHKYHSPSSWVGKECKITGGAGFTNTIVHGGAPFTFPIPEISVGFMPSP